MADNETRGTLAGRAEAIAFFTEHAGYGYDPKTETPEEGRARSAEELARAEEWARENHLHFQWWDDDDYVVGRDDDLDPEETSRPYVCIAGTMPSPWEPIDVQASLCGILFSADEDYTSDPYARVVEAELALEIQAKKDR